MGGELRLKMRIKLLHLSINLLLKVSRNPLTVDMSLQEHCTLNGAVKLNFITTKRAGVLEDFHLVRKGCISRIHNVRSSGRQKVRGDSSWNSRISGKSLMMNLLVKFGQAWIRPFCQDEEANEAEYHGNEISEMHDCDLSQINCSS
jgi:hypothetical protein